MGGSATKLEVDRSSALGHGAHGDVYAGTYNGLQVAIKTFKNDGGKDIEKLLDEIMKEAVIATELRHKNIVKLLAIERDPLNKQPILVFERLGPSIYDALDRKMSPPPNDTRIEWLLGIAEALNFLHEQRPPIIHRDLKPDNVLIHPIDQRAVLADFGRSTNLSTYTYSTKRNMPKHGHILFAPPECFSRGYKASTPYDVYSFGMTMYFILTRHWPFEGEDMLYAHEIVKGWILHDDRPPRNGTSGYKIEADPITDTAWTLIQRCWSKTIENRPNFVEIRSKLLDEKNIADISRTRISVEIRSKLLNEKNIADISRTRISVEISNRILGIGGFSKVRVGTLDDQEVAVKMVDNYELNMIYKEAIIGRSLSHQNIVKYLGMAMDPLTGHPVLVTELLENNLYWFIHCVDKPSFKLRTTWLRDIARAFVYLHSLNPPIIHRNLMPDNICLHPNDQRAVLTSFRLAWTPLEADDQHQHNIRGHIMFMPPEAMKRGYLPTTKYDVYSFGMTMYNILTSHWPFEGEGEYEPMITSVWIQSGDRPSRMGSPLCATAADPMSDEAWNLIQRCWSQNESERPSFIEIDKEIVSWD